MSRIYFWINLIALLLVFVSSCARSGFSPLLPTDPQPVSSQLIAEVLMRTQLDYFNPEKTSPRILLEGALREIERAFVELRTEQRETASGVVLKLWTKDWFFGGRYLFVFVVFECFGK